MGLPHGRVLGPLDRTLLQALVSDAEFQALPNAEVTFLMPDDGGFGGFYNEQTGGHDLQIVRAGTDFAVV